MAQAKRSASSKGQASKASSKASVKASASKASASKASASKASAKSPKAKAGPAKQAPVKAVAYVVKSEPFKYSFDQLVADGRTVWDGVRNFEARNTLRAMKKGDPLFFYHSNEGKEIVGLARVAREAYPDPTTDEDWSVVDVQPVKKLKRPVGLAELKAHPLLSNMQLVRRSRISVTPVSEEEYEAILELGETNA